MEINTLVKHKKLSTLGIGCISKVLKKTVMVNWGQNDVTVNKPAEIQEIDISKCSTIPYSVFRDKIITQAGPDIVIVGNKIKQYVGIGWITLRVVTEADLKRYPRVVK